MIQILALFLDFEGAKNINVLEVLIWALEYDEDSRLGSTIWNLIWIFSLVFDTRMFQILSLCLDFEGAKNINVL